jgi:xylulokinase
VAHRDGALFVGLDSSTQSLSAVVLERSEHGHRVVLERSLNYDEALPHYGTQHGVLRTSGPASAGPDGPLKGGPYEGEVLSSPLMWAEALDTMLGRLAEDIDVSRIAAISGSAQQHGSVYMNRDAARTLAALDPQRPVHEQLATALSREESPIWMDSSTAEECAEIARAVGGAEVLAQRTGSRAFERFTGPQIRKFFKRNPSGYAATATVHLVSSYLASLLAGRHAPLDPGDASGMNLMELSTASWWSPAVDATAPDLREKLPSIAPSWTIAGPLSPYWRTRHGLSAAKVVVWSGDNPCSLIGVGLVREGHVAISLGTSDTIFGLMREPRVDRGGTGHVFGAPTGDFMGITVFSNGSLARERVRDDYGMTWVEFSAALDRTPPGNGGAMMLPWFQPEITPAVAHPGVRRQQLDATDAAANVRAVVEAQLLSMALHSRWMGVAIDTIYATGGAAANAQILRVMADVFGASVARISVSNSAALGAALRALHADALDAGAPLTWDDVVGQFEQPAIERIAHDPASHAVYRERMRDYERFEAEVRAGRL